MIGGQPITLNQLERLSAQKSPLVNHGGQWVELRPGDIKAAEKFCLEEPRLSLEDALRLAGNDLEALQRLPVHRFEAGPRLQQVLEQYHHHKQPDPPARARRVLRPVAPYQERGWAGWPSSTALARGLASPMTWAWAKPSNCWPFFNI